MKFTVIWKPEAERRLTRLWLAAPDRKAITDAANRIDQLLENNPQERGESRDGGRRILLEAPLGVFFRVDSQSHQVWVIGVWRFDKR